MKELIIKGVLTMNKEQITNELKELKQERMKDLIKINAKHDMLVEFIANINYLIDAAEKESDNA